jgi:hypoxanthine phosphoribosyltransferase
MSNKITLDFLTIAQQLKQTPLPAVDCVVGIGSGGTVIASLVAYQLHKPLMMITINYRAPDNTPQHLQPILQSKLTLPANTKNILLVDDVSVSGQTLAIAKQNLPQQVDVVTLVLKGNADIVLFPEIENCVNWPWFS